MKLQVVEISTEKIHGIWQPKVTRDHLLDTTETLLAVQNQEEAYKAYCRTLEGMLRSDFPEPPTFNKRDRFEVPQLDGKVVEFDVMKAQASNWLDGKYWMTVEVVEE